MSTRKSPPFPDTLALMTSSLNRRQLLQVAAVAAASRAPALSAPQKPMRLGVITSISADPEPAIKRVHDLGFPACQLVIGTFGDSTVAKLRDALAKYAIEVSSAVAVGPSPEVYDFYQGPQTIGLVPSKYREARIARMKQVSDFAKKAGITGMQPHRGRVLQTERADVSLRDRPGDAHYAGPRH